VRLLLGKKKKALLHTKPIIRVALDSSIFLKSNPPVRRRGKREKKEKKVTLKTETRETRE